jgi:hypothetical protein
MIKILMSLITVFTSFFGVLGLNNSALANPMVNQNFKSLVPNYLEKPVSLNFSGSLWQINNQDTKKIFDHLGCSCTTCSQQVESRD